MNGNNFLRKHVITIEVGVLYGITRSHGHDLLRKHMLRFIAIRN